MWGKKSISAQKKLEGNMKKSSKPCFICDSLLHLCLEPLSFGVALRARDEDGDTGAQTVECFY